MNLVTSPCAARSWSIVALAPSMLDGGAGRSQAAAKARPGAASPSAAAKPKMDANFMRFLRFGGIEARRLRQGNGEASGFGPWRLSSNDGAASCRNALGRVAHRKLQQD